MPKKPKPPKPGMWSTIDAAVQAGWGPAFRLMCIITLVGALAVILTLLGSAVLPRHLFGQLAHLL